MEVNMLVAETSVCSGSKKGTEGDEWFVEREEGIWNPKVIVNCHHNYDGEACTDLYS
jgi:hypothetical protein